MKPRCIWHRAAVVGLAALVLLGMHPIDSSAATRAKPQSKRTLLRRLGKRPVPLGVRRLFPGGGRKTLALSVRDVVRMVLARGLGEAVMKDFQISDIIAMLG